MNLKKPHKKNFSDTKSYKKVYDQWYVQDPKRRRLKQKDHLKYNRTLKGMYARLKSVAKVGNLPCDITFDDFKQLRNRECVYECGNSLSGASHSLDRIQPKEGYTKDNVVPCCKSCNRIKGDQWTFDEMLAANRAVNALRAQAALDLQEKKLGW